MPAPNTPRWAENSVTSTTNINGLPVTYPNKVAVPEGIKANGLLANVPLTLSHLNYQFDEINKNLDYLKSGLNTVPTSYSKNLVVLGNNLTTTSVTYPTTSLIYQLTQGLANFNYSVVNYSSTNNTIALAKQNFYTNVPDQNPDIVLICLGIEGEGLSSKNTGAERDTLLNQYIEGMKELVSIVQQIGKKVVLVGSTPSNAWGIEHYNIAKQADKILSNLDVAFIDVLGTVGDRATGKWRSGMLTSGVLNDVAYNQLYGAFPLSLFDNLYDVTVPNLNSVEDKYSIFTGTLSNASEISYEEALQDYQSFTVSCNVKSSDLSVGGVNLISVAGSSGHLVVHNDGGNSVLAGTNNIALSFVASGGAVTDLVTSVYSTNNNKTYTITLVHEGYNNNTYLYVDGVLTGTATQAFDNKTTLYFASKREATYEEAANYYFSNMAVWRTALSTEQVKQVYNGTFPKGSLCLLTSPVEAALNPSYEYNYLVNSAPNNNRLTIYQDIPSISLVSIGNLSRRLSEYEDSLSHRVTTIKNVDTAVVLTAPNSSNQSGTITIVANNTTDTYLSKVPYTIKGGFITIGTEYGKLNTATALITALSGSNSPLGVSVTLSGICSINYTYEAIRLPV